MMKFLWILAVLCVLAQAAKVDELRKKLYEYKNVIDGTRIEQLLRGIDVIVQKKSLAKGDEAVNCVEAAGNQYLLILENNNINSTEEINKKLQGYHEKLNVGKTDEVEAALKGTLPKEVKIVLTNMQAKGEIITKEYIRIADNCIDV